MKKLVKAAAALSIFMLSSPVSWASLASYSQDFEDVDPGGLVIGDGWRFFVRVFESGNILFGYPGSAPNGPQISAFVTGQGGTSQGDYQLSVYSDYECCGAGGCPS